MSFTRVRSIKGHRYLYLEERWREGGKVRSKSIFLGAVGGGESAPSMPSPSPPKPSGGSSSGGGQSFLRRAFLGPKTDWAATFATEPGVKYEDEQKEWARQDAEKQKAPPATEAGLISVSESEATASAEPASNAESGDSGEGGE